MIFELPTFKVRQQLSSCQINLISLFTCLGVSRLSYLFSFPGILQEEVILNYIAYLPDCHKNFRIGGVQRGYSKADIIRFPEIRDDDGSAHLRIYKGFADKVGFRAMQESRELLREKGFYEHSPFLHPEAANKAAAGLAGKGHPN